VRRCSVTIWPRPGIGAQGPSYTAFALDGYRWQLDGAPITGQTGQTFTPASGDVGQQLSCTVTVTYPLMDVTASATSADVTVIPQNSGPAGANGANGATGPRGPAGKVELVSCKTIKHKHSTKKVCTTRLVSGPVKFTAAAAYARVALSRHGVVYATGFARQTRVGVQSWLLAARRLAPGRYTLSLTRRRGYRQITSRTQVTLS
jgi:hypothetical protein